MWRQRDPSPRTPSRALTTRPLLAPRSFAADQHITDLFIVGLATDYCIRATVLAALEASTALSPWRVFVVKEACRGVDADKSKATLDEMDKAGARIISIDGEELKPFWK